MDMEDQERERTEKMIEARRARRAELRRKTPSVTSELLWVSLFWFWCSSLC